MKTVKIISALIHVHSDCFHLLNQSCSFQHQFLTEILRWRSQTTPDHVLFTMLNSKVGYLPLVQILHFDVFVWFSFCGFNYCCLLPKPMLLLLSRLLKCSWIYLFKKQKKVSLWSNWLVFFLLIHIEKKFDILQGYYAPP